MATDPYRPYSFKIPLTSSLVGMCQTALIHRMKAIDYDASLYYRLRDLCRYEGTATLDLEKGQLLHMEMTTHLGDLREGSGPHKNLSAFVAALGDHIGTLEGRQKEWDIAKTPLDPQGVPLSKATLDALREEKVHNKLQNSLLREVFVGGPRKKFNMWGNLVDVKPVLPAVEPPFKSGGYNRHMRTARPLADGDVLDLLTNNIPPTFNEDMKREGAQELLQTNFTMGSGSFAAACIAKEVTTHVPREGIVGIVGTVSSYLKKIADSHSH